jgi:ribonuclease BN (tRNA processing enzyme)
VGFPFFKPLYFKRSELLMHKCPFHSDFVETVLTRVMSPPYFPVKYSDIRAQINYLDACPSTFEIGSVTVEPITISHPNNGSGYKFTEDGKSFVFLTDNELDFIHPGGLTFKDYLKFSEGADLLIHDAEYTPQEYKTNIKWGHSVFTRTLELGLAAGVGQLGLFHLNQDRSDQEMDEIIETCRQSIAAKGNTLECFAVGSDMTFNL